MLDKTIRQISMNDRHRPPTYMTEVAVVWFPAEKKVRFGNKPNKRC